VRSLRYLDLDFGTSRKLRPLGIILLAAGIVVSAYSVVQLDALYNAWQGEKGKIDLAISRERQLAAQVNAAASPAELQRYRNAVLVTNRLRTPWEKLLKLLETVPVANVALLSIEPAAAHRQLRISAEARDLSAMLDYLSFLQHQSGLQQVTLTSHQVQRRSPGSPVRFQVQAEWGAL
jgi:Tfp pilus assembly protein PilN